MFKLFIADTPKLRHKRLNELTFSPTAKLTDEEKPWVHFCREWDGLAITPACGEWECCSCYTAEIKKQKEDDFFKKFPDVERPQKMSDGWPDELDEDEIEEIIAVQEDYEAWAVSQSFGEYCQSVREQEIQEEAALQERWKAKLENEADDFAMLSLSAAELPDEEWNQ